MSLEEDEHADTFSEEYFHQLYNQKLKDWLSLQEQGMSEAEIYATNREETINFHEVFMYNQKRIEKTLPESILNMIADIRVFVLDKASSEVIFAVTQYCEGNKNTVNRAIQQYQKYVRKASKSFDQKILENTNFHDCRIKDVNQSEESLSISFDDNSGGWTDIKEIRFENYEILKQDSSLLNLCWLYDEIYKTNGLYELHVLLWAQTMDLIEFTICAEHISFLR